MATTRHPSLRPAVENDDVRAVRTRQKLVTAFYDTARHVDLGDMSVSELTRAAGVNRTSFYEHFASPEELAIHALSDLFDVVRNADITMRHNPAVSGTDASRLALREIVYFVHARRESYARLLGPNTPPQLAAAITDAFIANTVTALQNIPQRPLAADPLITAQFLAGGVLSVIGRWLSEPRTRWSRDRLVAAIVSCLPSWILESQPPSEVDNAKNPHVPGTY
jgi:AcrR family transcriptional regulator